MNNLDGKVALVTGAACGLGQAFAQALAAEGAAVALADLEFPHKAVDKIKLAGGNALGLVVDVADEISVTKCFARCADMLGGVDILINNAGIFTTLRPQSIHKIDMEEWDRVMAVNVRGTFLCSRTAARQMATRGYGKIVNITSGTVFKGTPFFAHYVASKGAVVALTRALSQELGGDGIRVNAVAAGLVMTDNVISNRKMVERLLKPSIESRALSRTQTPQDVVGAVVFLSSPPSDFITGQTLVVDGGSVTH
jgi:NAD(P)-dependent dehydrogenase (short-subunit alcohol dehydrogenase family)